MRRRGSLVSPESSADGFISKFKNTDRRDGGERDAAARIHSIHSIHTHRRRAALLKTHTINMAQPRNRIRAL